MLTNIHTVHLLVIVRIDVTSQSHFRVYKFIPRLLCTEAEFLDVIGTKEFSSLLFTITNTNGFYSDPWS
jgi:hypothetical protein